MGTAPQSGDARSAMLGARWLGASQVFVQLVRTIVYIVLARELAPNAFGLVAMAVVVTSFLDIFRDLGTRTAIVQRSDVNQGFLSSIYYLNVAVGGLLTGAVVLAAPLVAAAFDEQEVVRVLQVLSLAILVSSWSLVHLAVLHRRMQFGRFAATQVANALTHSAVSLTLAFLGFGVWALVLGIIASYVATTLTAWGLAMWRPSLHFEWADVRSIWRFSANLSGSQILGFFVHNADKFIIGRVLGAVPLGVYNLAQRLVSYPVIAMTQVIHNVLLPTLSRRQGDVEGLRRAVSRACCGIGLIVFPVMTGIAAVSGPFVRGILGNEWGQAVTVIAILAPVWALHAIADTVLLIYKAMGRTDLLLRWNTFSGTCMVLGYLAGLPWGLPGVAIAYGAVATLLAPLAVIVPLRMIGMSQLFFYRTLAPFFAINAFMVAAVLGVQFISREIGFSDLAILCISVIGGALVYTATVLYWRPPSLIDVFDVAGLGNLGNRFFASRQA